MEFKKREILPTLKISVDKEDTNGIEFKEDMQVTFLDVMEQSTKFGKKAIATIEKDGKKYNVFLNTKSINNLIEKYGEESDNWKGRLIELKREKDSYYNKPAIMVYPI